MEFFFVAIGFWIPGRELLGELAAVEIENVVATWVTLFGKSIAKTARKANDDATTAGTAR